MIKSVTIMNSKGLHARTSAMLASYVYDLKKRKTFEMHMISKKGKKVPISHAVQVTGLKLRSGDSVQIEATGIDSEEALEVISLYLASEIDSQSFSIQDIDQVLDDNVLRINSEMNSLKHIKQQLTSILDNLSDGICLMDKKGIIVYLNNAYEDIFKVEKLKLINCDAKVLFPQRPSVLALKNQSPILKELIQVNNIKLISNAIPIMTDEGFQGIITSYSRADDYKEVMKQLDIAEEKMNYYKNELEKFSNIHEAFQIIIGDSSVLKEALNICSKAAKTSATVIIRGESGTGKELVAQSIHLASKRAKKAIIKINCAAFPENLIESELFGYEKGAFTGAVDRKIGKFELAHEGTLFLDEIGELTPSVQVKLLRFIQEKEFRRIGGSDVIKVNTRIIAATNGNLEEMVKNGTFREDLYYRISVIQVYLPPLRDRISDIPLLTDYFIKKIAKHEGIEEKYITKELLKIFYDYHWPGNIRELENAVMRGLTMTEEAYIDISDMPKHMQLIEKTKDKYLINLFGNEFETMETYDKEIIERALKKYGSFNKTAKALGLTHRTISLKAKKYGITTDKN